MAHFDNTRRIADGRTSLRPTGIFGQFVGLMTAWNESRVTRNALNKLTDQELDDVGLTRADIDRVVRRRNF